MSTIAATTASSPVSSSSSSMIHPQQQYNEIKTECNKLITKIMELELDRNEHVLVEETLQPLDHNRRAYRLVGEILVERTVAEVLPSVRTNRINMDQTIQTLRERLEELEQQAVTLKSKFSTSIQE